MLLLFKVNRNFKANDTLTTRMSFSQQKASIRVMCMCNATSLEASCGRMHSITLSGLLQHATVIQMSHQNSQCTCISHLNAYITAMAESMCKMVDTITHCIIIH